MKTGIPLLEHDGTSFIPFSTADDTGIYILIPKLAALFSLSIESAMLIFFYGSLIVAWLISVVLFYCYYKKNISFLISVIGTTLLAFLAAKIGDVYIFYAIALMITIPLTLCLCSKKESSFFVKYLIVFLLGILLGTMHYIRAYAGMPALVFFIVLLITSSYHWFRKIVFFCFLIMGLLIPYAYFMVQYHYYTDYLEKHALSNHITKQHIFWHAVYAGLGFLSYSNPDNITWSDSCSEKKAQQLVPQATYNTPEYEHILRNEIMRLLWQHPRFIINTLFAKIGILLLYLLIFVNIGLFCAFKYPKDWRLELACWLTLASSSLFPLLTIPTAGYSLSFIAMSLFYGIISINYALLAQKTSEFSGAQKPLPECYVRNFLNH